VPDQGLGAQPRESSGPFGRGCASADVARTIEAMTQPLRRLRKPAVSEPL